MEYLSGRRGPRGGFNCHAPDSRFGRRVWSTCARAAIEEKVVSLKALTNCDVYTGEGVIPDGTIIIDGSRIVKVGSRAEITSEGTEVDLGGWTVTPGFIDL
jgi:imidazolonepropionase-like amidohydrolase